MINDLWYKNAVVYCLSVATYMDANGDGLGDFAGLMRRLDYLSGLGVTAIWLMPFQASRIVQKKNRHSSGCDPMVVAEHSAEALSALNRVMG